MRQDAQRSVQSQTNEAVTIVESHVELTQRVPKAVLHNHLRLRKSGNVESDISRNYSSSVVIFCGGGIFRGHDGVRESARVLQERLPDASFEYLTIREEHGLGFLEWQGRARGAIVRDGTDAFLIRGGKILVQAIHYTVERSAPAKWGTRAGYVLSLSIATSLIAFLLAQPPGPSEFGAVRERR